MNSESATLRILAVDPSLRGTGYAILETTPNKKVQALDYGVIKNAAALRQSSCLIAICDRLAELIHRWEPTCAAFESIIYVQSFRTAITLGAARGAAILAAAQRGLEIYEYAPRKVKQAVVGNGAAQKEQVAFMVRALLKLTETPPPDAADALAIGLTHFQTWEAKVSQREPLERI
jgi:crossover junction endodeoxyribonuclease RuvC